MLLVRAIRKKNFVKTWQPPGLSGWQVQAVADTQKIFLRVVAPLAVLETAGSSEKNYPTAHAT